MAKPFSRIKFAAFASLTLIAMLNELSLPAMAATAEALETTCRPADFSIPIAHLPRMAVRMRDKAPVRILAIGSSSTQGIGASSPNNAYPARLMTLLNSLNTVINVDVRNAGIGGETIDQTLARLVMELDTYKPDLVLWQVGTNDAITGGSDPKLFQRLIEKGIKSIASRHVDAILIDQQFYPKIPSMPIYEHYIELVHAAAADNDIVVFPRFKLMQAWNKELPGGVIPMLGPDQFHMGDLGYACLANLLANQITTSIAHTDAPAIAASPELKASPAGAIKVTHVGAVTPMKIVQPAN